MRSVCNTEYTFFSSRENLDQIKFFKNMFKKATRHTNSLAEVLKAMGYNESAVILGSCKMITETDSSITIHILNYGEPYLQIWNNILHQYSLTDIEYVCVAENYNEQIFINTDTYRYFYNDKFACCLFGPSIHSSKDRAKLYFKSLPSEIALLEHLNFIITQYATLYKQDLTEQDNISDAYDVLHNFIRSKFRHSFITLDTYESCALMY